MFIVDRVGGEGRRPRISTTTPAHCSQPTADASYRRTWHRLEADAVAVAPARQRSSLGISHRIDPGRALPAQSKPAYSSDEIGLRRFVWAEAVEGAAGPLRSPRAG